MNPDRTISQYKITRWTPELGAPVVVVKLAQDRAGFLWMATRNGLYRFDGITFEQIPAPLPANTRQTTLALLVSQKDEVWAYYHYANTLGVYRDGAMHLMPPAPIKGYVTSLAQTNDGAVWIGAADQGLALARYKDGRWETFGPQQGYPVGNLVELVAHPDGSLWAAQSDRVVRLPPGKRMFETVPSVGALFTIALDRQTRIWTASDRGTFPLTDAQGRPLASLGARTFPAPEIMRFQALLLDRDDNIWMNNYIHGLMRVPAALSNERTLPGSVRIDQFTAKDGLTSNLINDLFEDREGSVWVAGTFGLTQLSTAEVTAVPGLNSPSAMGDLLLAGADGTVYIAEQDTLYRVRNDKAPEPWLRHTGRPYALCEMADQSIVFASDSKFVRIGDGKEAPILPPAGVDTNLIWSCAGDRQGALWLAVTNKGWFRHDGSWKHVAEAAGPVQWPNLLADRNNGVLISHTDSSLDRLSGNSTLTTLMKPNKQLGEVRNIFNTKAGFIMRGPHGIALYSPTGVKYLSFQQAPALEGLNGLVELGNGTAWAVTNAGILRFQSRDLERAFSSPSQPIPMKVFDYSDGVSAPTTSLLPQTIVAGGDGRLWVSTDSILMMIDSRRLVENRVSPGVRITQLYTDGKPIRDPLSVKVPAGTRELRISFSAPSLSKARKVQVRYRLEGFGDGWIDPGPRRDAFYTNLAPGTYRFQVIAANDDGVWNREGATLEFTLAPTFIQSIWFKLLIALAAVALATLAYRLRLRQVTARLQGRFDTRIAERERIARELHDTLLQGVQGLMLRFQSVANRIPAEEGLKASIDDALDRADAVLVESRARVRELRVTPASSDLTLVPADLVDVAEPKPEVQIKGTPRTLHPLVREEVQRIAEEAVRNALSHAQAKSISILLEYGPSTLRLTIGDDGIGMPEQVLASGGKEGHFGLTGMRERAARIGGEIRYGPDKDRGTEVTLTLPARAAYSEPQSELQRWLRRLWPGRSAE